MATRLELKRTATEKKLYNIDNGSSFIYLNDTFIIIDRYEKIIRAVDLVTGEARSFNKDIIVTEVIEMVLKY